MARRGHVLVKGGCVQVKYGLAWVTKGRTLQGGHGRLRRGLACNAGLTRFKAQVFFNFFNS
jgi:hypothetical protein